MRNKLDKILVPVDMSPYSRAALDYAWFLTAKLGATMDILHIAKPADVRGDDDVAILTRSVPGSTLEVYNEQEIQEELTKFLKSAGIDRKVRNDEIEQGNDPAAMIVKIAAQRGYDLIVMGTHG